MKTLAAVCVLSFGVLVTKVVVATGPTPDQAGAPAQPQTPCKTDADCPGCQRCNAGFCPGAEVQHEICMCHEECTQAGFSSCDVSPEKPLCGGRCLADKLPSRELTCGAGDDVVKIESLTTAITDQVGGAKVLEGTPVVVDFIQGAAK